MATANDLIEAIKRNDLTAASRLLDNDPTLANARSEDGLSMILWATYYGRANIVELLLNAGAQLDIFEASAVGNAERVAGWLAMKPELANSFAPDGFTPLGLAAFFGHLDVVNALLGAHADPNTPSNNIQQVAPLHSAVAAKHYEIAARLIESGANVNAKQQDGFTPLHGAAQNGDARIVELLLQHGADVNARVDKRASQFANMTALDLARLANAPEVVALLQGRGAR